MSDLDARSLSDGGAYRECVRELQNTEPDCARAQVFATLSLQQAVADVANELSAMHGMIRDALTALGESIDAASR